MAQLNALANSPILFYKSQWAVSRDHTLIAVGRLDKNGPLKFNLLDENEGDVIPSYRRLWSDPEGNILALDGLTCSNIVAQAVIEHRHISCGVNHHIHVWLSRWSSRHIYLFRQ